MKKHKFNFNPIQIVNSIGDVGVGQCSYHSKNAKQAREWQAKTRRVLANCLGFLNQKKMRLNPQIIEEKQREGFIRKKIVLHTSLEGDLILYLLLPNNIKGKMPCVLALHGHGYGVRDIVGIWDDGTERLRPEGYHADFACELANRGFIVAAPEVLGFGMRHSKFDKSDPKSVRISDCYRLSMNSIMYGGSVQGIKVWENMRVLDYLQSLPFVDKLRIGAMGISGGGQNTFFTTCLEPRIKACVISGYFCEWEGSIMNNEHCVCNFIPGVLKLGKLSDLAGLIAPRPCLIEHGTHDADFPIEYTKKTVRAARRAWKTFSASELLETDYFAGYHRINGIQAYDFFLKHLK